MLERVKDWVSRLDSVPTDMICRLLDDDDDDWCEVTRPSVGKRVYVFTADAFGEVVRAGRRTYKVELDNGETIFCGLDDMEVENRDFLPMCSKMWHIKEGDDWLRRGDRVLLMSRCGFRVYESTEYGFYFGIDGAGYDFYEAHWIPLYRALFGEEE